MKTKIDNFIHQNFHQTLLVFKIFLIITTIIYFIFVIIIDILEKTENKSEKLEKWKNGLAITNNILFFIIIFFILILCIILMYITRGYSLHALKESYYSFFPRKEKNIKEIRRKETKIMIPKVYLTYYISIIWWTLLYLLIITIIVMVAKIKHDPKLIYNFF